MYNTFKDVIRNNILTRYGNYNYSTYYCISPTGCLAFIRAGMYMYPCQKICQFNPLALSADVFQ